MSDSDERRGDDAALPPHRRPDRTVADLRLEPRHRWAMLVVLVALFLFAGKSPIWRNPFDIDQAVGLSYAPIPVLVAISLAVSRRLSLLTWLINTFEITLWKFGITYTIATVLWAVVPPKPDAPRPATTRTATAPTPPPPTTPWPDARRHELRGEVITSEGAPQPQALVYVADGLEDMVFPAPDEPGELRIVDGAFVDDVVVVMERQPLRASDDDRRLHPLQFRRPSDGDVALVAPIVAELPSSPITTMGLEGWLHVECLLHGEKTRLLVLRHPYFTRSDDEGRFTLAGVPDLEVTLAAWHLDHPDDLDVRLEP